MNFGRAPRIKEVVLQLKHKAGCDDRRFIVVEMALLQLLTGRRPIPIFAQRPIAELEARRNQCIGTEVRLKRRPEIREFLTKVCLFAMGRDEEFSGVPAKGEGFKDGRYSFDIRSLLLFPETEPFFDIFETVPSIGVTLVTNARSYHPACDPERLPLSDYWWLQRDTVPLRRLDKRSSAISDRMPRV